MTKILLVDDDRDLAELLVFALPRAGFEVVATHDATDALRLAGEQAPDIVLLDLDLGTENGFDLLRKLQELAELPVILLTARSSPEDKVLGLELGADDYVTKPFSYPELVARIRALLRRIKRWVPDRPRVVRVGPLELNPAEHTVQQFGKDLELTVTEFRLLSYLMTHDGVVIPTRDLMKQVWGLDDHAVTDVVRAAVYRLRRKLGDDPRHARLLHTIPGVGVMLKSEGG